MNLNPAYLFLSERALYSFECSFHTLFNYTQGKCRLDYTKAENRSHSYCLHAPCTMCTDSVQITISVCGQYLLLLPLQVIVPHPLSSPELCWKTRYACIYMYTSEQLSLCWFCPFQAVIELLLNSVNFCWGKSTLHICMTYQYNGTLLTCIWTPSINRIPSPAVISLLCDIHYSHH